MENLEALKRKHLVYSILTFVALAVGSIPFLFGVASSLCNTFNRIFEVGLDAQIRSITDFSFILALGFYLLGIIFNSEDKCVREELEKNGEENTKVEKAQGKNNAPISYRFAILFAIESLLLYFLSNIPAVYIIANQMAGDVLPLKICENMQNYFHNAMLTAVICIVIASIFTIFNTAKNSDNDNNMFHYA